MEFTFLGTSSGTPTTNRNVSGFALKHPGSKSWYLVDCGEGTQHQILRTSYSLLTLEGVFITHVHGDHCYGLPGILASASMAGRREDLHIFGPPEIKAFIDSVMQYTQLYLPYGLIFHPVEKSGELDTFNKLRISAIELSHRVTSYAYKFIETDTDRTLDAAKLKQLGLSGPIMGKLKRGEKVTLENGQVIDGNDFLSAPRTPLGIVVGGDNDKPELLYDACADVQVLVHETTYTQEGLDKAGPDPQHCSSALLAKFAENRKLPNLIMTHFSPRYRFEPDVDNSISDLENDAKKYYQGNLYLAEDFQTYRLERDLELSRCTSM